MAHTRPHGKRGERPAARSPPGLVGSRGRQTLEFGVAKGFERGFAAVEVNRPAMEGKIAWERCRPGRAGTLTSGGGNGGATMTSSMEAG